MLKQVSKERCSR